MKKIFIILSVIVFVVTSCETDFDVNSEWAETTVVYGLLDAGKELQQVKISKAFLGEMDALQMAQYADSVNYKSGELNVRIYKTQYGVVKDSVLLSDTLIYREGDIFHDSVMIYTFFDNNFLKKDYDYNIVVENKSSGNVVEGNTKIVGDFSFGNMDDEFKFYKPFNPDTSKFTFERIEWGDARNASIYQLIVRINYIENNDTLYLDWVQPLVDIDNLTILQGRKFFSFLEANKQLEVNNTNTVRRFQKIDLYLIAGTEDLNTYIKVNEPITGIVQQRPSFTNINNGIGLFSSRFTLVKQGEIDLSDDTKEYVSENLDLNFQ
jgi:hypothetical protein